MAVIFRILCYAIVLPGRKSSFRAGFRPDSSRESIDIGPPAGFRPAGGPIFGLSRLESGRNPTRKVDFRPGSTVAQVMVKEKYMSGGSVNLAPSARNCVMYLSSGKRGVLEKYLEISRFDRTRSPPPGTLLGTSTCVNQF